LSPEADTEHRTIAPNYLCDEAAFSRDKWVFVGFVNALWTAYHYQPFNLIRERKAGAYVQAPDLWMETSRIGFSADQSRAFPRHML